MKTMKENWVCPDAQVQVFTPQEFVAACETVVLDLFKDITNGQSYTLKLDGGTPAVGQRVGAHMAEQSGDNFTAFNCGEGRWMIFGAIREGHTNTTTNGEFDFVGASGLMKCEDPDHQLYAQTQPYQQHHHFSKIIEHNVS